MLSTDILTQRGKCYTFNPGPSELRYALSLQTM